MRCITNTTLKTLAAVWLALLILAGPVHSADIRKPAYAGRFYPEKTDDLTALIDRVTNAAQKTHISLPVDKPLKALIMPHAGYIYSGPTAAHAYLALKNRQFKKIIILGPDHHVGFTNCAISDVRGYETPLGVVLLHPDAARLRREYRKIFRPVEMSDNLEHSIEVEIPFLQRWLHGFEIIPIVTGPGDVGQYAEAIDTVLDPDTLVIASSDLSHYLPYADAVKKDTDTIRMILNLDAEALSKSPYSACGSIGIQALIHLARSHHWKPVLIHRSNSGDTAGPRQAVVGYATIAFYGDSPMNDQKNSNQFTEQDGAVLLNLARQTIAKKLGMDTGKPEEAALKPSDEIRKARRGTFVTLKINNQLRGCIGNLTPDKTIMEGVEDNAINAAFHDPRFNRLTRDELEKVDIEVSLLTEPRELAYKDADDLLAKLRPNIDGVIIRKGIFSATFLPQVWEQLPDKEMFLNHLCLKAGLPATAWQTPGLKVMTYQVQYFDEAH
jgi:AmmeMemoRadiSam system protein B/AmmeMemoRadiSam system protein A